MTREEFNKTSTDVLAEMASENPDTGKISEMLDNLRTGFNDEATAKETAEKSAADLKTANEGLQKANMSLFLKIGQAAEEKSGAGNPGENPGKKIEADFDSLFDENGELI